MTTVTLMPNFRRSVAPARAAMVAIDSRIGSFDTRRSVCQKESKPPDSSCSIQRQKPFAPSMRRQARALRNASQASPIASCAASRNAVMPKKPWNTPS